jgi:hypothetical protein
MSTETKRLSWRRTLGHAGVYLAMAGWIAIISSRISGTYQDSDSIRALVSGIIFVALAVVCEGLAIYLHVRSSDGIAGTAGIKLTPRLPTYNEIGFFFDIVPYWLSRLILCFWLFFNSSYGLGYYLFFLPIIILYLLIRWGVSYLLRRKNERHWILLPLDILAFIVFTPSLYVSS